MVRFGAWAAAVGLSLIWSGAALAQQQTGTRGSGFAYDPSSGLLVREVVEPDLSEYRLQTDYGYDAFGNKVSVTVSGSDIATRVATTTYDVRGQFALSSTNALNQSESFTYDPHFGLPLTHTGPNGLTTSWQYDDFGRKVLEIRPDGTRTRWSYRYCSGIAGGTDACPAGAVSLTEVKVLAADDITAIAPITKTYKDELDRDIAGDTQGFDGQTIRGLTEYDELGRVKRKSRPFFLSGGTPVWTTTDYDVLNRPVLVTEPDNTTMVTTYSGLTTIAINALGQTKVTEKNSQDNVVAVTDAEGYTATFSFDPFGNLVRAVDPVGNVATNTYDRRGRKVALQDPDMGAWSYSYNVLDQLVSQTDAKNQTTTLSYDLLGRVIQRVEPDLTSNWTYDTAVKGIGKLASATTNGGYARTHDYDALGRPSATQISVDGESHTVTTIYDAASRVSGIQYPSGLTVAYSYNALGYQTQLSNPSTGEVYWTANDRDAELRLIEQTSGNGVVSTQTYDNFTGRLSTIKAGAGNAVQDFGFGYDLIGNLTSRTDANTVLSETFTYDGLNRLRSATVGVDVAKLISYDEIGNILNKSDVGAYSYPAPGQPFPHAVSSISGSVINTTFSYDANGNLIDGNGLTYSYASFNKPTQITRGTTTISFDHNPEHQRFKQIAADRTTVYLAAAGIWVEKVIGAGGTLTWNNYLFVAGKMIGMRVEHSSGEVQTRYFHRDHLGSVAILTNETGVVVERLSYDAWGKRRNIDGTDDPAGIITSQATRGFTGHEQLDDVGLIHMNGRVYDPLIGRFGTPDPMTESPFSTQGWNRYAYVGNSPLNFTDPSGYCFAGCVWQAPFKAAGRLLNKFPILGQILQISATAICTATMGCSPLAVAALSSSVVTGLRGGNLGQALKSGLFAAVNAAYFNMIGDITLGPGHPLPNLLSGKHLLNMAGHALVGCMSSMASGGKCGSGAASAAAGSFSGPLLQKLGLGANVAAHSVVGGVASVAGGGKFGNGAVTAAFGYLFNQAANEIRSRFKTQDDAAQAALQQANPQSIRDNLEYGGLIYETGSGYDYTNPISGGALGFDMTSVSGPESSQVVGDYHTHGAYSLVRPDGVVVRTDSPLMDNTNADNFSEADISSSNLVGFSKPGYRSYLGTPSGTFKVYEPYTQKMWNMK